MNLQTNLSANIDASQIISRFEISDLKDTRSRIVHSRSPVKQVRTKTIKDG